ncbi:MAG: efflux RND transporter periplasmic adaptor subunit [Candidatus Taylorbacteria bacterium]
MKHFFKNKYVIAVTSVLVIFIAYLLLRGGSATTIESSVATIGDVIEKVGVTGKISPVDKADLSFGSSGSIAHIFVKVGDKVKKGDLLASLDNADAVASLASAQAKLDDITRSLRPEELQLEKARVDSASAALNNAKVNAVNAVSSGYVLAQSAVVNYADNFFKNPQSANPTINIRTQSDTDKQAIDSNRLLVSDYFRTWKTGLEISSSTGSALSALSDADKSMSSIKIFMDNLSVIVNDLNPGNSSLSQTTIDSYIAIMNTGLSTLNQAVSSVSTAKAGLDQAQTGYDEVYNSFVLKNSGVSSESIRAQQATVDSLSAVVSKGRIYSPIDGIVTRADPHEGEYTTPGMAGFAVQSEGLYKIEAYVPEADIAKTTVGDTAEVTLDAYGSDTIFGAKVTFIDPAETMLEGVPTYKVTLQFTKADDRIRSGMTANTDILTHRHNGVLYVPTRAIIINSDGTRSVRVMNKDGKTYKAVNVVLGLKGSNGTTEIVSGIVAGDKVVTYIK